MRGRPSCVRYPAHRTQSPSRCPLVLMNSTSSSAVYAMFPLMWPITSTLPVVLSAVLFSWASVASSQPSRRLSIVERAIHKGAYTVLQVAGLDRLLLYEPPYQAPNNRYPPNVDDNNQRHHGRVILQFVVFHHSFHRISTIKATISSPYVRTMSSAFTVFDV